MEYENPNTLELQTRYDALMSDYIDTWDDEILDQMNRISAAMANAKVMEKMFKGSTVAIVEYSKLQRMRHKDLNNPKSELNLEEMEIAKVRADLYTKSYGYKDATDVLKGAMDGEITPKRAKELMELQNIVVSDTILKKLEALEAKIL